MPSIDQTLLQHLRIKNPCLDVRRVKPGPNTTSGVVQWDIPRQVEKWKDFEYQSLYSMYDGALQQTLQHRSCIDVPTPTNPACEIHEEPDMTHLVGLWNATMVQNALDAAQDHFSGVLSNGKIEMCQGGQAQRPSLPPGAIKPRKPDWAGRKPSTADHENLDIKAKNLLPGDTKMSQKWDSGTLHRIDFEKADLEDENWFQPIAQIYTYAVRCNARYAYIITDKELVVFRIRPRRIPATQSPRGTRRSNRLSKAQHAYKTLDPSINITEEELGKVDGAPEATRALDNGMMEYKAILWKSQVRVTQRNSAVMTINLALWWLHMMAAQSSGIKDEYVPLRDVKWMTEPSDEIPGFDSPEMESQETAPLTEISSSSQNIAMSFGSGFGEKKRSREDEGDTEMMQMASPPKRRTRGQKQPSVV